MGHHGPHPWNATPGASAVGAHVADTPSFYNYSYDELKTLRSAYEMDRFHTSRQYYGGMVDADRVAAFDAWNRASASDPKAQAAEAAAFEASQTQFVHSPAQSIRSHMGATRLYH